MDCIPDAPDGDLFHGIGRQRMFRLLGHFIKTSGMCLSIFVLYVVFHVVFHDFR